MKENCALSPIIGIFENRTRPTPKLWVNDFSCFCSSYFYQFFVPPILENHIHQIVSFKSTSTNSHYGERFLQWSPGPIGNQLVTKHPVHTGNTVTQDSHLHSFSQLKIKVERWYVKLALQIVFQQGHKISHMHHSFIVDHLPKFIHKLLYLNCRNTFYVA